MSKSKAQEVAKFRAEVQKYIETGESDVLTDEEKSILDPVSRKNPGILDRFKAWLSK